MSQYKGFQGMPEDALERIFSYLYKQTSTYGVAVSGVLAGLAVTQTATASASVTVAYGAGVVDFGSGATPLLSNSPWSLDVLSANPVGGTPRNDIVIFDSATTDNTAGNGGLRVLIGVPNAAPTDPTVPNTAIPLARIRHLAGGGDGSGAITTARIDDLRVMTSVAVGDLPARVPFATAAGGGVINTTVAVDALSGPYPQTFPAGRFSQVPNLTFGTTDARCTVQGTSITTSGFNLYVRNNSASAAPAGQIVTWTATQMTSTSASG